MVPDVVRQGFLPNCVGSILARKVHENTPLEGGWKWRSTETVAIAAVSLCTPSSAPP